MAQDIKRWTIANDFDRQNILKALAIAIATIDVSSSGRAAADRMSLAELLTRLADEGELELYRQNAMSVVLGIVDEKTDRSS